MDPLHERLAELADDAPTGDAPAAGLGARGKRAHRLRAAALAATVLVVGAVGTGIGMRLADGDGKRAGPARAGTVGIALPIEYPVGEELPDLGDTPGPLAAIWVDRVGGGAPGLVGLVAESGAFGTLPIDMSFSDVSYSLGPGEIGDEHEMEVELSHDGRRIAYLAADGELVVRDLVSGESYSPAFEYMPRPGFVWIDATHLLGHDARGGDTDGWVWGTGTAPKLVDPYLVPYGGTDLSVPMNGGGGNLRSCSSSRGPILQNVQILRRNPGLDWAGSISVAALCDVLGLTGSGILLGHWNSDRLPGDWNDPHDGNRTVVALDIRGVYFPTQPSNKQSSPPQFDDPAMRHVVVTKGAPLHVTLAADVIAQALDADGGAS